MEKNITLTLEKARELYGKNPEMDELLLANFTEEELEEPILPKSWEDISKEKIIKGYYIDYTVSYIYRGDAFGNCKPRKCLYNTFKQAKSALAMAQLSQLMEIYNDGWEPNWESTDRLNFSIVRYDNKLRVNRYFNTYCFLTFQCEKLANQFLENFEPLIKEYFMMD